MARSGRAHYVTSIDRAGLALAAGGAMAGCVAAALVIAGGQRAFAAIVTGWVIGGLFSMLAIVAVAGPVWLALHIANHRGPTTAAATGGLLALGLFTIGQGVAGQGWGTSEAALAYRLASALATSLLVAVAAAAIGWVMQRIAYRRIF